MLGGAVGARTEHCTRGVRRHSASTLRLDIEIIGSELGRLGESGCGHVGIHESNNSRDDGAHHLDLCHLQCFDDVCVLPLTDALYVGAATNKAGTAAVL